MTQTLDAAKKERCSERRVTPHREDKFAERRTLSLPFCHRLYKTIRCPNNIRRSENVKTTYLLDSFVDLVSIEAVHRKGGQPVKDGLIAFKTDLFTIPGPLINPRQRTDQGGGGKAPKSVHGPSLQQKGRRPKPPSHNPPQLARLADCGPATRTGSKRNCRWLNPKPGLHFENDVPLS